MAMHIGKLIKKHIEQAGMNKSEFARRINSTPQNVYSIFKRKSMDTDLLKDISRVLGYDFFQHYMVSPKQFSEEIPTYRTASELRADIDKMKKEAEMLRQENKYLKEINDLLRDSSYGKKRGSQSQAEVAATASSEVSPARKKKGQKKKS